MASLKVGASGASVQMQTADVIIYDKLVNTIRAQIPESVSKVRAKVTSITNSADRQALMLAGGEELSARLVVLAKQALPRH